MSQAASRLASRTDEAALNVAGVTELLHAIRECGMTITGATKEFEVRFGLQNNEGAIPAGWDQWYRMGLTHSQSIIAEMMLRAWGRGVTRVAIHDALYGTRPQIDEANLKTVDVYVCHLRKKLRGSRYSIDTVWGIGYRMRFNHEEPFNGETDGKGKKSPTEVNLRWPGKIIPHP